MKVRVNNGGAYDRRVLLRQGVLRPLLGEHFRAAAEEGEEGGGGGGGGGGGHLARSKEGEPKSLSAPTPAVVSAQDTNSERQSP